MLAMKTLAVVCLASLSLACSAGGKSKDDEPIDLADSATASDGSLGDGTSDGETPGDGNWDLAAPCTTGLKCKRVTCPAGEKTTLSGTVYDPSGKLPLYNVVVYIPNEEPAPLPKGVSCDKCGALVTGQPIVTALTDARGQFTLTDVPVDENVPLVVQVGKWRRQFVIPKIDACTGNSAPKLQLPSKKSQGNMPQVAVGTGGADALECLFQRMGIDAGEFGGKGSSASFHLYNGLGGATTSGTTSVVGFWDNLTELKKYDMVILSCEGSENPGNKSGATGVMHDYASAGGRIFASHYHYYWFNNGPSDFQSVATWTPGGIFGSTADTFDIDQGFPKGKAFADWLYNVKASTTKGKIDLKDIRNDVSAVNTKTSQRWIYKDTPKYFTFNTPVGKPSEAQCGRVVFTDLHVSSGNLPGGSFPGGCTSGSELTPQEKALVFLFFDLASCVQNDGDVPTAPPPK